MGACDFYHTARGKDAREAFSNAREEAFYDHGHSGYTGTIAEKNNFVMVSVPEGYDPMAYADRLIGEDNSVVSDKWGPAGCIKIEEGKYLFFGWAST